MVFVPFGGLAGAQSSQRITAGVENLDAFARLPVLQDGREMPVDSFARLMLKSMSGRQAINDKDKNGDTLYKESAVSWLARAFFHPASVATNQIFVVDHPGVLDALGIPQNKGRRYSYDDLQPVGRALADMAMKANEVPEKERDLVQKETMQLFANLTQFLMLTSTFEFARPHPDFAIDDPGVREVLNLDSDQIMFSFLDIYNQLGNVRERVIAIAAKPQEEWTEVEHGLMNISSRLFQWSRQFQNLPFAIVPAAPHGDSVWLSPWDALHTAGADKAMMSAVVELGKLATAYQLGDQAGFDRVAQQFTQIVESRYTHDRVTWKADKEYAFNKAGYFTHAMVYYILAVSLGLFCVLSDRKWLRYLTMVILLVGFVYHLSGLTWRILITGYAPVTNLYTTFLFVSLVAVILGLIGDVFQKNGIGLFSAALVGASLLFVASRFAMEGDTMHKVVAVLNSNFWLSTHVTSITMGYAGCWLAGIIGHLYLIWRIWRPAHDPMSRAVYRMTLGVLAFGLTFAFLGTFLGGVWADQSWGRFWGWDPKENGALLIVLWTALLYHARLGNMISETGMAAGVAGGCIWVMLAWMGVNLLNTGLHSYGFTSGLAFKLMLYIVGELILITILWVLARYVGPSALRAPAKAA